MRSKWIIRGLICVVMGLSQVDTAPSFKRDEIILDAQSRVFFESIIKPLLKAAGVSSQGVELYLIVNPEINAFALPGGLIGMYTGLIEQATHVSEIMGVLAHEIGHLKGTHHTQRDQAADRSMILSMMLATILGGASIAAGSGEGAMAGISAGMHVGQRDFLKYNRSQERAADIIAIQLLKKNKWPTTGLADFFKLLSRLHDPLIDTYELTHPDSQARAKDVINMSEGYTPDSIESYENQYKLVRAKILAFTLPMEKMERFIATLSRLEKKLAEAIYDFRKGKMNSAMSKIQEVEALSPNQNLDIYLTEFKAQVQFESGNTKKALELYHKALDKNHAYEIVIAFAQALTQPKAHASPKELENGLRYISVVNNTHPRDPAAWFIRGKLYSLLKNTQGSDWCLAEYYVLVDREKDALRHAERAEKGSDQTIKIKAQDLAIMLKGKNLKG